MKLHKFEGIIIKRKNYHEADKILTVFTKEVGKIQIKAKGIRKITSKRASHTELLNHVVFSAYKNQGIPVLTEVIAINTFYEIKENLEDVGFAYHICELIDRLCPEGQGEEKIFTLLCETISLLPQKTKKIEYMNEFGRDLLGILGYGYANFSKNTPVSFAIENIIEGKLKARQIIPKLI